MTMAAPFDSGSSDRAPLHAARPKTIVLDTLPPPAKLYGRVLSGLLKGRTHQASNRDASLPALRLVRPGVPLDIASIERYARVCGFIPEQGLPLTYPHLLAFPLHLMLLTEPAFPWSALGLVHLANSVRLRRPIAYNDVLRVEVEFGALLRHDKGQAFVLHSRLYRRGEAVWDGDSVYLKRGVPAFGDPLSPLEIDGGALVRDARWQLAAQLGRDYAHASGDYNPIHLSMLSAKAFGFPRAIAHGMWTLARAAAALQPRKPLADAALAAEFKLPMLLPGEASLWAAAPASAARELEVRDAAGQRPHLRGRFQWTLR
jgi:hypothetical protein